MRSFVTGSVPKFVTSYTLILAATVALVACNTDKNPSKVAGKHKEAVGANTKTGGLLIASEMCGAPVTDSTGKTTIASFRFQQNAVFLRRVRLMTNRSRFPVDSETGGTWGLVGETLFITENGVTVQHTFDKFERETDKAPCFRFTKMENAPEFCACEI